MKKNQTIKKEWSDFKDSGFLWWVNTMLQIFGWVITVEDNVATVYRTSFREVNAEEQGINEAKMEKYLLENANELEEEAEQI